MRVGVYTRMLTFVVAVNERTVLIKVRIYFVVALPQKKEKKEVDEWVLKSSARK